MPQIVDDNRASQDEQDDMDSNVLDEPEDTGEGVSDVDNSKDPVPSANTRKKQKQTKLIQRQIEEVMSTGATVLELNDMAIDVIPAPLLDLQHVQVTLI